MKTRCASLPSGSRLNAYRQKGDFVDCFLATDIDPDLSMAELAHKMVYTMPAWARALSAMRDWFVRPVGLKTADDIRAAGAAARKTPDTALEPGDLLNFFRVREVYDNEIIVGEKDRHLDFRVSIYKPTLDSPRAYVSTWVRRHNAFGYLYLAVILPFHKAIVFTMTAGLNRANAA